MTIVESVTVTLACSAQQAFDFMWDPASSRVMNDDAFDGMTLPGTPTRAVGEVQVFLSRPGGVLRGSMIEVESLVEGRRAVTRGITESLENRQVLEILPLDDASCHLTQEFSTVVPPGASLELVAAVRASDRVALDRLGACLVGHFGSPGAGRAGDRP